MSSVQTSFATIEEAIEDIRQGKMVVVVDDPLRCVVRGAADILENGGAGRAAQ